MDSARPAAPGAVPAVAMVAPAIADRRIAGVADRRVAAVGAAAVDRPAVVVAAVVACPVVACPVVACPVVARPVALPAVVRKFAYYQIGTGGSHSAQTALSR